MTKPVQHTDQLPTELLVAESVKEAASESTKQVNETQRVVMMAVFMVIVFWLFPIGIAIWSYVSEQTDSSIAQRNSERRLETHLRQYCDDPVSQAWGQAEFRLQEQEQHQSKAQKDEKAVAEEIDFSKYINNERLEERRHQGQPAVEAVSTAVLPSPTPKGQFSQTQIIERVESSVVAIGTQNGQSLGSGFILDTDNGIVVTNLHVIDGQRDLVVEFHDGQTETVLGFLGFSESNDLAALKVGSQINRYPRLNVADRLPRKGEVVLAFGNPLGLNGSVTNGIVSSIRKASEFGHAGLAQWIQHSAPISPGNSGGPLVDGDGKVVGVNTLGINPQIGQNLNFAIASLHILQVTRDRSDVAKPLTALPARKKLVATVANSEKKPIDDEPRLDEVKRRIAGGEFREALKALEGIPALNRGAGYWRARARTLFLMGDYPESAAGYATSLQMDNSDSDTWIRFATALRLQSLNNSATILTACRAALKIDPTEARAYHLIGVTQSKSKKDSIDAFMTALMLDDSDLGSHFQIGCQFAGERKAEARKHFKKALDLIDTVDEFQVFSSERYSVSSYSQQNSFETVLRLHLAAVSDGEEATSMCREVLKNEPDNGAAYWLLGMETRRLGTRNRNPAADALQDKGSSLGVKFLDVLTLGTGTSGLLVFRK